jgi:hypothetical protein
MEEDFVQKHKEYSLILNYPPFSTSLKKREEYASDIRSEDARIISLIQDNDEKAYERMYSTLEAKWADDLEEARLYQKRYPNNPEEAQKVVLKMEGRENNTFADDNDLPMGLF